MIVRQEKNGEQLLIGQTDHSRLAGQFAAHWGNERFALPDPFESVVRAATFHDFGYLRYETAPEFSAEIHGTPSFRNVLTNDKRLEEHQQSFDWLLSLDPYAANLARMHRCGLWRGRYAALTYPPHSMRPQKPEVDAFTEKNEAIIARAMLENGWDKQGVRTNYRLLQFWDLLSLYLACQAPVEDYMEPVPAKYSDSDAEGVKITLTPQGATTIAIDPYPFDAEDLHVQLGARRLKTGIFDGYDAFIKAYFQAPLEVLEFTFIRAEGEHRRAAA
jgi:hypothetical protein